MDAKPRLLDQVRDRIRLKHYSYRIDPLQFMSRKRFQLLHGKRHPSEPGTSEVEALLSRRARQRTGSKGGSRSGSLLFPEEKEPKRSASRAGMAGDGHLG